MATAIKPAMPLGGKAGPKGPVPAYVVPARRKMGVDIPLTPKQQKEKKNRERNLCKQAKKALVPVAPPVERERKMQTAVVKTDRLIAPLANSVSRRKEARARNYQKLPCVLPVAAPVVAEVRDELAEAQAELAVLLAEPGDGFPVVPAGVGIVRPDAPHFRAFAPVPPPVPGGDLSFFERARLRALRPLQPDRYNEDFLDVHFHAMHADVAAETYAELAAFQRPAAEVFFTTRGVPPEGMRALPRASESHDHPRLHDTREFPLACVLALAAREARAVFDMGGCVKRWRDALCLLARLEIPLPRIKINAPVLPTDPALGSCEDAAYRRSAAAVALEFPGVFSICQCDLTRGPCPDYRRDDLAVAVDSAYYFRDALWRYTTGGLYTIGHCYRVPTGRLGSAAHPEMRWTTYADGQLGVSVGSSVSVQYTHQPLDLRSGQFVDANGHGFALEPCLELTPFGTMHAYSCWRWEAALVLPIVPPPVDVEIFSAVDDQRDGAASMAPVTSRRVVVVSGAHGRFVVPADGATEILALHARTHRPAEVAPKIAAIVNNCAAVPTLHAPFAQAWLQRVYENAQADAHSWVFGNATRGLVRHSAQAFVVSCFLVAIVFFDWFYPFCLAGVAFLLIAAYPALAPSFLLRVPNGGVAAKVAVTQAEYGVVVWHAFLRRLGLDLLSCHRAVAVGLRAVYNWTFAPWLVRFDNPHPSVPLEWLAAQCAKLCCPVRLPGSLMTAWETRGWRFDLAALTRFGYSALAGGDDVLAFSNRTPDRATVAVGEMMGYPLTDDSSPLPEHGDFFSSYAVPMLDGCGERTAVMVMKLGRFLSRANYSVKPVPEKYALSRLYDNALCYERHWGGVPVISAFVRLWKRLATPGGRLPPALPRGLRGEFAARVGRFYGESRQCVADLASYEWLVDHYGGVFSVSDVIDYEYAIEHCPSLGCDIAHPVADALMAADTEYRPPVAPGRFVRVCATTVVEELVGFALYALAGVPGAVFTLAVGALEVVLTGRPAFLLQHLLSAGVCLALGSPVAAAAHLAWNLTIRPGREHTYRAAASPTSRYCSRENAAWPTDFDPTFRCTVKVGNRSVYAVRPTQEWRCEANGVYLGQKLWTYRCRALPGGVYGSPAAAVHWPCSERTHSALSPQRLGPGANSAATVSSDCLANVLRGVLLRRAVPRPPPTPVSAFLQRVALAFVHPLRLALRGNDRLLHSDMDARFEWWVNRPGFATAVRRLQLRTAWEELQIWGAHSDELYKSKTFNKKQLELKAAPKPRGISALCDKLSALRGPTTQMVAEEVGKLLAPGVYPTLPGCLLPFDVVWAKGAAPDEMARIVSLVAGTFQFSDGTDASTFDKNHLEPMTRAVELVKPFYPKWARRYMRDRQFFSECRVPTQGPTAFVSYSYEAGMMTGEPDVSLRNTLIRLSTDIVKHSATLCAALPSRH